MSKAGQKNMMMAGDNMMHPAPKMGKPKGAKNAEGMDKKNDTVPTGHE